MNQIYLFRLQYVIRLNQAEDKDLDENSACIF